MKKIDMADDGLQFSPLIQGYWRQMAWNMSPQALLTFIEQHLELGITTVDHADIYGDHQCEAAFGKALALSPSLRDQLEIVTKADIRIPSSPIGQVRTAHYDTSAAHLRESVENSLKHFHTDHLDVLLIHRPDFLMNADEVAREFESLKQSGKVRHFGVSNFTPSQFELLQSRLDDALITNQVEFNPVNMGVLEDGTFDQLQMHRVKPMIWSCLAGGAIFAKETAQTQRLYDTLATIGEELGGVGIDQVIFAWILKMPVNPLPILGTSNIERVKDAVNALSLTLTHEQWYRIWVASKGHGVP
ncbi:aldo/keto reductase [Thaumasiovibrio subtropicus]|uniref:aldo/keto reductase n=1 Tax=Thaumasiovibrio subtropicus TaxID=1891207 RepID=UPI000B357714|nr:aldo/keto reductase family oxidoreductase [Thaumasiovibrio subtropicus]